MSIRFKLIGVALAAFVLFFSCSEKRADGGKYVEEEQEEDIPADTVAEEEEELSLMRVDSTAVDGIFDEFLFAYLHSRSLRRQRTAHPLRMEHIGHPAEMLEQFDPEFELSFLSHDYFTTLYGSAHQMQEEDENAEEDSIVSVQRINLNDGTIRNFQFLRERGRWQLAFISEATFADDILSDFLTFYARFCTDSVFQGESIADPLRIVMQEYDDETAGIEGIIDADQWQTFCPEVPSGIISNIRKGQHYGGNKVVMRKSGLSNGLQEVFTFTKERAGWRLTKYEN